MLDATPLLRLYAGIRRRRLAAQDAATVQRRTLLRLLAKAARTRFGTDHQFARIRSVADFQRRVPLRRYEDFWEAYWKRDFPRLVDCTWPGSIPFFAVTSGTTSGATKYIPCSHEMNRANERAALEVLVHHISHVPRSAVLKGKSFVLGGSTDLVEAAPGVRFGDLSGIAASQVPRWARGRYFPPRDLALIADWEEKVDRLAEALLDEDIRSISGTPSWLLILFDKLAALRPDSGGSLSRLFPDLDLLVHGGVNFAPYRQRFGRLLEGSGADLREVYPASEGFIAIADRGYGEGLRLLLDNGLFFEFVPVAELEAADPPRHWIETVEPGVDYALVVTSCAGLWAYVLGDTVKIVDRAPPRLLITGRISYMLSAFGEHLIGEEIEAAVAGAATEIGAEVTDYAVGALYPERDGVRGSHLFIVEFSAALAPAAVARFARAIDDRLRAASDDYAAHRAGDYGMAAPTVQTVKPGGFAAWMKARGQLGGQHKVPRVINDPALLENLRAFCDRY